MTRQGEKIDRGRTYGQCADVPGPDQGAHGPQSLEKRGDPSREFPIFFTHFHWDHLQGIPFFGPAWVKGNRLIFASPVPSVERTIRDQMKPPYFPVTMDAMPAELRFVYLQGESPASGAPRCAGKE